LQPPISFQPSNNLKMGATTEEGYSLNPADLSSGNLAGEVSIGGDKVPFWKNGGSGLW